MTLVLILNERPRSLEVRLDHLLHEGVEVDLAFPAQDTLSLGGVAEKKPVKTNGEYEK